MPYLRRPGSCADITQARQLGLAQLLAEGPFLEILADAGYQGRGALAPGGVGLSLLLVPFLVRRLTGGADLVVRTLDDAEALASRLATARSAIVLGGGTRTGAPANA